VCRWPALPAVSAKPSQCCYSAVTCFALVWQLPSPQCAQNFQLALCIQVLREAEVSTRMNHPNVVATVSHAQLGAREAVTAQAEPAQRQHAVLMPPTVNSPCITTACVPHLLCSSAVHMCHGASGQQQGESKLLCLSNHVDDGYGTDPFA
jgi:hypothetical protein